MFHYRQNADLYAAKRFMQEHSEAVQNAAFLLGGSRELGRAQNLLDELRSGTVFTRRMKRGMKALHDLLTLQHVADPDREESGYFADIDPADPAIEEICLLSDGLLGILMQTDAEEDLPVKDFNLAA